MPLMEFGTTGLYNLPNEIHNISEGVKTKELPVPAKLAPNSWHNKNYGGPCPPHNSEHHYYFKLYALKDLIKSKENMESKANIEKAIQGRILGKAVLIGKYACSIREERMPKPDIEDALTIIDKKDVNQQIKEKAKNEIIKELPFDL